MLNVFILSYPIFFHIHSRRPNYLMKLTQYRGYGPGLLPVNQAHDRCYAGFVASSCKFDVFSIKVSFCGVVICHSTLLRRLGNAVFRDSRLSWVPSYLRLIISTQPLF